MLSFDSLVNYPITKSFDLNIEEFLKILKKCNCKPYHSIFNLANSNVEYFKEFVNVNSMFKNCFWKYLFVLKKNIFFLKLEIFLQFFYKKQLSKNLFFEEHILNIFSCFRRTMLKNKNTNMETDMKIKHYRWQLFLRNI